MYGTLKTKINSISSCCRFPPFFFFSFLVLVVVEGEWAVLVMVWKQEVTARPKETHLQPEIPPSSPTSPSPPLSHPSKSTKKPEISHHILSPMANWYLTRGDCINLRTRTLTHNRTLRPVSLCPEEFFFFFSFFVFFSLLVFSSFIVGDGGRDFFLCVCVFSKWKREGRGLIVRECWREGVFSKGNTTMLFALGPWKREKKRVSCFLVGLRRLTPISWCDQIYI